MMGENEGTNWLRFGISLPLVPSPLSLLPSFSPLSFLPFGRCPSGRRARTRTRTGEAFNLAADRIMWLSTRCYDFPRRRGHEYDDATAAERRGGTVGGRGRESFEMPLLGTGTGAGRGRTDRGVGGGHLGGNDESILSQAA